jgi:membrane AbrB-like protein
MPGGLNDMMILGEESGGSSRKIALAHATRILVVISFVVLFYGLVLGVESNEGPGGRYVPLSLLTPSDWIILGACAAIGAPVAKWLNLPAPQILGPMILSGVTHGFGFVHVAPPTILVVLAQIVVGTVVGCRFIGATVREILHEVVLGGLSSLVMIGIAIFFALGLSRMSGDPLELSFLVLSPGGLTEMSLLALAMGQDVIYVTTLHIIRISLVIAMAAPVFRLIRRLSS